MRLVVGYYDGPGAARRGRQPPPPPTHVTLNNLQARRGCTPCLPTQQLLHACGPAPIAPAAALAVRGADFLVLVLKHMCHRLPPLPPPPIHHAEPDADCRGRPILPVSNAQLPQQAGQFGVAAGAGAIYRLAWAGLGVRVCALVVCGGGSSSGGLAMVAERVVVGMHMHAPRLVAHLHRRRSQLRAHSWRAWRQRRRLWMSRH